MRHHRARLSAAVIIGLTASLATISLAGQSQTSRDVEATKEAERKLIQKSPTASRSETRCCAPTSPKNWKPARTPWGDPDLSGVYSNSDESGIPFEKPAQFEGRRLEDITAARAGRSCSRRAATRRSSARSALSTIRRPPAAVLVGNLERHQQPRLARRRPAGRTRFRRDAGRRSSGPRRAPRRGGGAGAARPTPTRTAACTTGASRAACRDR